MKKNYAGPRLKRFREEKSLTQQALANALGISLSYLNQIENNQRPITMPVMQRLGEVFGVDSELFSEEGEARLMGGLRRVFSTPAIQDRISNSEIREIASNMPAVGHAIIQLHRQMRQAQEHSEALAIRLGDSRELSSTILPSMPYEKVRDYFYTHGNHVAELDICAEKLARELGMRIGRFDLPLSERLEQRHGVRIVHADAAGSIANSGALRTFDPATRVLTLSPGLRAGQRAFQMATQLCFLEHGDLLTELTDKAGFLNEETVSLARIGLANYFAGSLILPYGVFLEAAESLRYDIDLLGQKFGVGFETVCHRLSTLQRPGASGVPFFFVRVDRAGNISKRQSATDFHFSRIGGTCPLWTVYEAFASPGRICTQLAEMPDGRAYLWIARTVTHHYGGYGEPEKTFAIGLGCDLNNADRLVYSRGLALDDHAGRTKIGGGCRLCERKKCAQRAFPPLTSSLKVNDAVASFSPYASNN